MVLDSVSVISLGILLWFNVLVYIGLNIQRIYQTGKAETREAHWIYEYIRNHSFRAIILILFVSILVSIFISGIYYIKPLDLGFIGDGKLFDIGHIGIVTAAVTLMALTGYRYNLVLGQLSLLILLVMSVAIFAIILPALLR